MSNYIGVRCPVCNKKFTETDDIVVCPDCGAPHHRECYMQLNQCAFAADHLSGKEWSDPCASSPGEEARDCARCGAANPCDRIFCQVCGNPLNVNRPSSRPQEEPGRAYGYPPGAPVDTISMAYGGLSPDETIEDESVRDLARYIGGGSAYYLPKFQAFSKYKHRASFNFSPFIFSYLYFFYRKMYLIGALLLALYVLLNIPFFIIIHELGPMFPYYLTMDIPLPPEANQILISQMVQINNLANLLYWFLKGALAILTNHFYFNRVIRDVRAVRTGYGKDLSRQQYDETLSRLGGVNKTAVFAVGTGLIAVVFLISLLITF